MIPVFHSPSVSFGVRWCFSSALMRFSSFLVFPSLVPFSGVRRGSALLCLPSPPPSSPLPFTQNGGLLGGGGDGCGQTEKVGVNHAGRLCLTSNEQLLYTRIPKTLFVSSVVDSYVNYISYHVEMKE